MAKIDTEILKVKQHFEILHGLRGIAGLSIVFFMEIFYQPSKNYPVSQRGARDPKQNGI